MKSNTKIVVFTGAGMSAESGISTFRDANGLWENHRIEDVATPQAWRTNADLVTEFYNVRRKHIIDAEPNEAHLLIAQLEQDTPLQIITQNIDDLHERAGSNHVLHLHGNIRYAKSSGPNQESTYYRINGSKLSKDSCCPEGYRLRPHVVWFGEAVPALEEASKIINTAEILIVIGTSLQVYPAAGLIHHTNTNCRKYIIDPKVNMMDIPSDFTAIQSSAVRGLKTVITDIKKALNQNE